MTLRSTFWQKKFMGLALLEREEKKKAVVRELTSLTQKENLTAMLDEFVKETKQAPHHHSDSYTHDNGFDKMVLFQDSETKMKMRLHIWHPIIVEGIKRVRQNVHNHRWDFSSVVLTFVKVLLFGRFVNILYPFFGIMLLFIHRENINSFSLGF